MDIPDYRNMYYLTLDTNTWIYLANGTEPARLLTFVRQEVDKGNIKILVPDLIIKEWDKNKDKAVKQGSIKHFKDITQALDRIVKLLGDKAERNIINFLLDEREDKAYFTDFVETYKKKRNEIEEAISDNIKLIDDLFRHKTTEIIKVNEKEYVKAGQYALEKKAPFRNKNSFADALIVFSLLDYVKQKQIEGALFITYNTNDFCNKKDGKHDLHPDLKPDFEETKTKFYTIVGKAINTIKTDIVSKEELEWIKQMQEEAEWEKLIEYCQVCDGNKYNFGNEVYFNYKIDLVDERAELRNENPNQEQFEFSKHLPKAQPEKYFDSIKVGYCSWCNTEHFKCPSCGAINALLDNEYNVRKECDGCGLPFLVDRTYDKDGIDEGHSYKILVETKICSKCGLEFENDGSDSDLCEKCEGEYIDS